MKKVISFVLCIALALSVTPVAFGANVSADEARNALKTLGLLYGTEQGFEEERSVTRSEATVMMLRLLGEEHAAEGYKGSCPFTDCAWAEKYIGYAWSKGYAYGVSDTLFGSAAPVGVRDYLTMMLRVLGYSDTKGDFSWSGSIVFSDSIGLTRGEYRAGDEFTRRDMALVSYTALTMKIKDSDMTLAERLYTQGAVSAAALKATRLAGAVNAGKREYTAAEIYERSASAVFFARMYDGPEAYKKDKPSGTASGFFITADGVAVMSYHQLDGMSRAFAQTSDGRSYEISRIIYYDAERDVAVARVSKTDTEGETVRFFPYLDVGDPEAVYVGERVCAIGNPLNMKFSISEGIISYNYRVVDDPAYPCIQTDASISPGSSGGALINRWGEAIGVVFAYLRDGQNLNLAVPLDFISDLDLTASGVSLEKVRDEENVKKENAVLRADVTELVLRVGESREVLISHDYPGMPNIEYNITRGAEYCEAVWGEFETKKSIPLIITGKAAGETVYSISFSGVTVGADTAIEIKVNVTE